MFLQPKITPPLEDINLGLLCYSTGFRDRNASQLSKIKLGKGDFIVNEIIRYKLNDKGMWFLYCVKKPYGVDTMSLKIMLYKKIPGNYLHFYGLKDKYAVAYQYVTVHPKYCEVFTKLLMNRGFSVKKLGTVDDPNILRKSFEGNRFKLVMYNPPEESYLKYISTISTKIGIPNYYGYQRFGIYRVNHLVGKAILLGRHYLDSLPESLYMLISRAIDISLISDKKELYKKTNRHIIRFFINSLQSYLLNKALSLRLCLVGSLTQPKKSDFCLKYIPNLNRWLVSYCGDVHPSTNGGLLIPIIGYDYLNMLSNDSFREFYLSLLDEEGLSKDDFKQLAKEKVFIRGGFRKALMKPNDITYLYNGSSLKLSFKLGRGEYATIFLRELIKPFFPQKQGF